MAKYDEALAKAITEGTIHKDLQLARDLENTVRAQFGVGPCGRKQASSSVKEAQKVDKTTNPEEEFNKSMANLKALAEEGPAVVVSEKNLSRRPSNRERELEKSLATANEKIAKLESQNNLLRRLKGLDLNPDDVEHLYLLVNKLRAARAGSKSAAKDLVDSMC